MLATSEVIPRALLARIPVRFITVDEGGSQRASLATSRSELF
jgi:hypothetical protein